MQCLCKVYWNIAPTYGFIWYSLSILGPLSIYRPSSRMVWWSLLTPIFFNRIGRHDSPSLLTEPDKSGWSGLILRVFSPSIIDQRADLRTFRPVAKGEWNLVGGLVAIFCFPINIGLLIIPIDFHIFQRGGPTTNQEWMEWLTSRFFAAIFWLLNSVGNGGTIPSREPSQSP